LAPNKPITNVLIYHGGADTIRNALLSNVPGLSIAIAADDADFKVKLANATVVIGQRFDPALLRHAEALDWLHITLAGVDFLAPAKQYLRAVTVTNARGLIAGHLANYVIGVVVMMQWKFPELLRNQTGRLWKRWPTKPLAGQVIAIVGLGAIGQEVAKRAVSLGLTAIGVRASGVPVPGVTKIFRPAQILECLQEADFIVMAVPSTIVTAKLIGEREFAVMKSSAYFINIARGAVVDEDALVSALENKKIAGACLDVFEQEPLPEQSPLWSFPNVIITPHSSGVTTDYDERNAALIADNFRRYNSGHKLTNIVNVETDL
jgi:phosphoglycerate dehydrogenase-like enzyme